MSVCGYLTNVEEDLDVTFYKRLGDDLPVINSLDDVIGQLRILFESEDVDIDLVRYVMRSYKSNPADWKKYAKFDRHRLHPYHMVLHQALNDEDFDRRIDYCHWMLGMIRENRDFLSEILWTDEDTYYWSDKNPHWLREVQHQGHWSPNVLVGEPKRGFRDLLKRVRLIYRGIPCTQYTRNLVDHGNGKYNLMLLCWGEGHGSAIHDHSDAHCFMKILQGSLNEIRFAWPEKEDATLREIGRTPLNINEICYINDSIGLHRVENLSNVDTAISLHLYCPPYEQCSVYNQNTGQKSSAKVTFYSMFGKRMKERKQVEEPEDN